MTSATSSEGGAPRQEVRFEIRGRVQGVGFRWWTRTQANQLDITGTVRNRQDGSVEVMARGSPEKLDRFRELLRQGPPGARVDGLEEEPAAEVTDDDFEIVS